MGRTELGVNHGSSPPPPPPPSGLRSHPPCHRIRSSPSWIRQEVADTQQAAEKAKAAEEQLPSQVLLLPAKGLKVRGGFRLCFKMGFQQMVQCIFTEIQSGKLRRRKCF